MWVKLVCAWRCALARFQYSKSPTYIMCMYIDWKLPRKKYTAQSIHLLKNPCYSAVVFGALKWHSHVTQFIFFKMFMYIILVLTWLIFMVNLKYICFTRKSSSSVQVTIEHTSVPSCTFLMYLLYLFENFTTFDFKRVADVRVIQKTLSC